MVLEQVRRRHFRAEAKAALVCAGSNGRIKQGPARDCEEADRSWLFLCSRIECRICRRMHNKKSAHENSECTEFNRQFQFVYPSQSKFQSSSLCSVDAAPPSLQTCSSLYEEGV
jgi:hypothetical protein